MRREPETALTPSATNRSKAPAPRTALRPIVTVIVKPPTAAVLIAVPVSVGALVIVLLISLNSLFSDPQATVAVLNAKCSTNTVEEVFGSCGGILRGIFDVGAVRAGLHTVPQ